VPPAVPSGDGRFSLRFNPASTLNPLTGEDADNMALSTLCYEGLFALNADFTYRNVLCESFESADFLTYDFTFVAGVYMSDGDELSPYDVVYSIEQAKAGARYGGRLKNVVSAEVIGPRTVRVEMEIPNARLPALLDIPIIKDGASGTVPRGCGPYKYAGDGEARLVKNTYHRDAARLPIDAIYLVSCADAQLGEYFTEQRIDLIAENSSAPVSSARRDHEARYYYTTVLQFIGFNPRAAAVDDVRFRAAVEAAADREAIVQSCLGTRGAASRLALPPFYRLYESTWEGTGSSAGLSALLGAIGMTDADSDTYLEYPVDGVMTPFSLDFIVGAGNDARLAAAKSVSDALRRVGLNITLRELPFEEFKQALEAGDFDMYYGETRLPADFDLSALVGTGGALNYGNVGGEEYDALLGAFLAARGDFAERGAARELCERIRDERPFIPIAYRQYAVYSGRNEIAGLEPSQTGVFCNIADWTIEIK
jgi:peptide/nickel transport system substrate-binding protein